MNWFSLYLIRYSKQYLYRGQYLREAVTLRFEGYCPVSLLKVSGFRKPPEGSDTFMLSSLLSSIPSATILPSPSKKEKGILGKSYVCPSLSDALMLRADGKHPEWMTDFQMNFTSPNPAVAKKLLTEIEEQKFTLISDMANDPEISNIVLEKKPSLMRNAMKFAQNYMNKVDAQQESLGKAPKMDLKTFSKLNPRSSR